MPRTLAYFAPSDPAIVDENPAVSQPVKQPVTQPNVSAIVCATAFVVTTLLFLLH